MLISIQIFTTLDNENIATIVLAFPTKRYFFNITETFQRFMN